jgi:hypothetical protein
VGDFFALTSTLQKQACMNSDSLERDLIGSLGDQPNNYGVLGYGIFLLRNRDFRREQAL